ncbi:MAG: hypothetical protein LHW64_05940 [Candidatus Cloacimonetes bacterium]|jgi:Tfp pilus assembly protein PilO|nr:hypothetical protein [Candidatus Cloacimonadota bacterium]MCB5287324.1 hypothetical protein [Candidatus Cloacimonadota bacterium]MCK9184074.1 hypothetical protein [Candidatus Cloacimonadota bacterium]MCK9584103.1 hypothetical protein [Candidatus Cloacimonadota bacterium]MDY0229646.1 hypothetical protein [Candidatus Cloacimonadaceae bacterium]
MTNTSRNTLVLASLLLVNAIGGFLMINHSQKKLEARQQDNTALQTQINSFRTLVANRDSLEIEHERQMLMASQQSKVILQRDTQVITYDYLLKILQWLGTDIIYDYALSKQENEQSYNEYVISGSSDYMDVVQFTRLLEHQRALITVEDITLAAENIAHSDTVSFSMILRTYYADEGVPATEIDYKAMARGMQSFPLFKSKIWENLPVFDENDYRLIDVELGTMLGISESRVFLRDRRGIIRILKRGDEVLWGHLWKIDHREGLAIFKLNKYGFEENFILSISYQNEERKNE